MQASLDNENTIVAMTLASTLTINELELPVHLGWTDEERSQMQIVLLNIAIHFPEPPKACMSDELQDTLCYARLIDHLKIYLANKSFHLVEHLSSTIYHFIKSQWSPQANVMVSLTKYPVISQLSGGICFRYGDAI